MSFRLNISLFCAFLLLVALPSQAQEICTEPADPGIIKLLDGLALKHVISINTVSMPWSRSFMAVKLREALQKDSLLTPAEKKEIAFYLSNFSLETAHMDMEPAAGSGKKTGFIFSVNPVGVSFMKGKFAAELRPILDFCQIVNVNDAVTQVKPGIAAYAYLGKHIGILAGIVRQFDTQILANTIYFTPGPGGKWKSWSDGGGDWAEWFGQFTVSWKWGMVGFFKDRFVWGDNYNGTNIFSDKAPSYPRIRLYLHPAKWIEFEYFHGWLNAEPADTLAPAVETGGAGTEDVQKHMAANIVTFKPWKDLNISVGNSIVYDGPVQLAYLIPFLFYKSVDHTLTHGIDNENSQLFFSISSRQIRHLNLFLALFVDEFMMSRIRDPEEHNFLSWKAGLKLYDFPLKNLSITLEGTRTLPGTYQHYLPTTTFTSSGYNMGHYLRENSQDIFVSLEYRMLRGLSATASYVFAEHGADYNYSPTEVPTTAPVLKDITWKKSQFDLSLNYTPVSNLMLFLAYEYRSTQGDVKYTPPVFLGKSHSMIAGIRCGF